MERLHESPSTWPCLQYSICCTVGVSRGLALPDYHSLMGLHMILGIFSILLGILFVTNRWKWKGKKYMNLGAPLWTGTFLLGVTFYMQIFGFP